MRKRASEKESDRELMSSDTRTLYHQIAGREPGQRLTLHRPVDEAG